MEHLRYCEVSNKTIGGPAHEIFVLIGYEESIGESFQDYSGIQDFEADYP